ncbi:hypothetical protein F9K72_03650 [Brucella intermedia]|nr:hypothetical protein F9K72_03650 [Brucella intermedia]
MAWSVDRLGRSLQGLVAFLSDLHALRVDLFLHPRRIDTITPAGKAMFQKKCVFAEFERAMISERLKAGLSTARAKGKKLGKPGLRPETEAAILCDLHGETPASLRSLAAKHGVSLGMVHRLSRELNDEPL